MELHIFAPAASRELATAVAHECHITLSRHEEREFEDREHKIRPLVSVRGADVYVVQSLHDGPDETVNDKLCRLLFFIGALRDAGASRVTAIAPYLCYARKDRRTKPRDPVTTRYVATLFEAVGVDRVVTVDVHNPAAYENAFRCRTEHLEARHMLLHHLQEKIGDDRPVVVSPDVGGVKRANRFRDALSARLDREVDTAFVEKQRSEGVVSGDRMVGAVEGRVALIVDDLISTGTTLLRAARACRAGGAKGVFAAATHGLFLGEAGSTLADPAIDAIVTTDTVPPFRLAGTPAQPRHTSLAIAPLLGRAIRRLHDDGSIVELAEGG